MKKKLTAVFDIGKTNKKFFLFDKDFQEVYREYTVFGEIEDEDGFLTEDLEALQRWVVEVLDRMLADKRFNIKVLNFTTYGASLVHLDKQGKPLSPLYNYNKIIDQKVIDGFYNKYGPEEVFSRQTGTTNSGMLNSGMQLYWLKNKKPELFRKIKYSLHLPQYLSYLFTGIPVSEYTSIGCHTSLWDYEKKDYHDWVYQEEIDKIMAPIVSTETCVFKNYKGKSLKIGVGIHDSSAALIPYIRSIDKPFILVSTGTWSVSLNPFSIKNLSEIDIQEGCINYMQVNGNPVKSSRILLGGNYQPLVKKLGEFFQVSQDFHKTIQFDRALYLSMINNFEPVFFKKGLENLSLDLNKVAFENIEQAYHHLMIEIVHYQVNSVKIAKGNQKIKMLYVDGGFTDNDVFIELLAHYLCEMEVRTTNSSLGTALGAAIVVSTKNLDSDFLIKNYELKNHLPFLTA